MKPAHHNMPTACRLTRLEVLTALKVCEIRQLAEAVRAAAGRVESIGRELSCHHIEPAPPADNHQYQTTD